MGNSARRRVILALALLLAVGVFLVDVYLTPALVLPGAAWSIPILVAALGLSPRAVATVAVLTLVLQAWAGSRHQAPTLDWALHLLGVTVVAVLGVMLAARIRRETALAEDRVRLLSELEATLEAAPAGVVTYDASGRIVRANSAAERIMGYTEADRKLPMAELVTRLRLETADGQPLSLEAFPPARALRGERVAGVAIAFHRADESGDRRVWIYDGAGPIRSRTGTILGAVASFVDVSELRELQERQRLLLEEQVQARRRIEELAQAAARRAAELQAVLDNLVDAVFVVDQERRLTLTNTAAARLFGLPGFAGVRDVPAEFPALLGLRHPDGRPIESEEMATARALRGETVVNMDQVFYNPRLGEDRYIRVSAAPVEDASGQVAAAVVVARDVTELIELDRLKDEFVAVAAHELKTPVTIVKGYAQTLQRTAQDLQPPRRRILEAIDRGAGRITAIVEDLLDISQLHLGRLEVRRERVDLAELVEEVVDRVDLAAARHRIRLASAEPVVVQADRARLEQVLGILLDNAIRYSPGGGDVDVAVSRQGGEVVVSVADHGVGIPKERQAHIFERFYRAHTGTPHDYGGMGVGLYISREIVKRHGGRMWFESEAGKGSTFSFALPLAQQPSPASGQSRVG